jgi:cytochrome P450
MTAAIQPLDEMWLGGQEFWAAPMTTRESAFAHFRAEQPMSFHEEMEAPPLPKGPGFWAVTKHADIVEASRHPDIYSSAQGITLLDSPPEFNEFFGSMIAMDDPRHGRLRRLVSKGFTPKMLKKLEDDVQLVASRIVDDIGSRGEVDFVTDVAAALPLRIICEMMGIPASQYDEVFRHSNVILGAGDPEYVPMGTDGDMTDILTALLGAGGALAEIMKDLARYRVGNPIEDDLTSILVNAEVDGESLSHDDLASFFILLVVAGNETTRNAISWGLTYLTEHPDQRAIWAADFEAVAPTAVDEIVRVASPVIYMRRTLTRPAVLGGQELDEGAKVAMFYWSANRDEDVFDEPDRFDVLRQPNEHVGFGGPGPHYCLGAHLARREITVMFRELFRRLPDIEASGPPDRLLSSFVNGVKHLPATFTPGG